MFWWISCGLDRLWRGWIHLFFTLKACNQRVSVNRGRIRSWQEKARLLSKTLTSNSPYLIWGETRILGRWQMLSCSEHWLTWIQPNLRVVVGGARWSRNPRALTRGFKSLAQFLPLASQANFAAEKDMPANAKCEECYWLPTISPVQQCVVRNSSFQ